MPKNSKRDRDAISAYIDSENEKEKHHVAELGRLQHIVSTVTIWMVSLLGLRGMAAILSAGHENTISSLLNIITSPFVFAFRGVANYDQSAFQAYTAIAIIVYSILGWTIVRVLGLLKSNSRGESWR